IQGTPAASGTSQMRRGCCPATVDQVAGLIQGEEPRGVALWSTGASTPTPVRERTSISDCSFGSSSPLPRYVPTIPAMKPAGMETKPGSVSGNQERSTIGNIAASAPETAQETKSRTRATPRPTHREATAPVVLNFFQYREYRIVGRLADAAMQNARETRKATF